MRPTSWLSTLAGGCALVLVAAQCDAPGAADAPAEAQGPKPRGATSPAPAVPDGLAAAVFAGGCFWCMEHPFERLDGVGEVVSGYTGGAEVGPSYREVASGRTGHVEAVRIVYDPERVRYEKLLEVFFRNVDPTQDDGQFCDRGPQYRTAIFVANAVERRAAEAARGQARETLGRPIVTEIRDAGPFYVAEAYHQDYYRTHPAQYQRYRRGCGRDARLEALWGDAAGGH